MPPRLGEIAAERSREAVVPHSGNVPLSDEWMSVIKSLTVRGVSRSLDAGQYNPSSKHPAHPNNGPAFDHSLEEGAI